MSNEELIWRLAELLAKLSLLHVRMDEMNLRISQTTYQIHEEEAAEKREAWEHAKAEMWSTAVEDEPKEGGDRDGSENSGR